MVPSKVPWEKTGKRRNPLLSKCPHLDSRSAFPVFFSHNREDAPRRSELAGLRSWIFENLKVQPRPRGRRTQADVRLRPGRARSGRAWGGVRRFAEGVPPLPPLYHLPIKYPSFEAPAAPKSGPACPRIHAASSGPAIHKKIRVTSSLRQHTLDDRPSCRNTGNVMTVPMDLRLAIQVFDN